jgi:inner membrane transporter RhtA
VTRFFLAAVARLPLGTASALEILGPLGVTVVRGRGRGRRLLPALAGAGGLLLTEPWHGAVDTVGLACALAAACCWAGYVVLTQRVGDAVTGLRGLVVSLPVAGFVATAVAGPSAIGRVTPELLLLGLELAVLLPVVPFALELLALRRLSTAAFVTLMSLEPAIATAVGLLSPSARFPDCRRSWGLASSSPPASEPNAPEPAADRRDSGGRTGAGSRRARRRHRPVGAAHAV